MAEAEFVQLTGEARTAAHTFQRKMLEAASESNLADRVLLAIIAQEMGDLVAMHKLVGDSDPEELVRIMMLNFKQGFANRLAHGLGPSLNKEGLH